MLLGIERRRMEPVSTWRQLDPTDHTYCTLLDTPLRVEVHVERQPVLPRAKYLRPLVRRRERDLDAVAGSQRQIAAAEFDTHHDGRVLLRSFERRGEQAHRQSADGQR